MTFATESREHNAARAPRRVFVTGVGVVSPSGTGKERFWKSLIDGESCLRPVTRFDAAPFATKIAGEVRDFRPTDYMSRADAHRIDRSVQFAMAATRLAVDDAGLTPLETFERERIGVVIGTCHGPLETVEREVINVHASGGATVSPYAMVNASANMAPAYVAIQLCLGGPNFSVVSACASGTQAVGEAYRTVARGDAEIVLAGGTEASITPLTFAGYSFISAMSRCLDPDRACRPFDVARDGFVMSEGAGVLVLESDAHARRRHAGAYAELLGYGASSDAHDLTGVTPDGRGVQRAMTSALADAALAPQDIAYVNAHGSSTRAGDRSEAQAIAQLFGAHRHRLSVNSTKSITGHLMGAAGAVEAIATVLTISNGAVHGTRNYERADDSCPLDTLTARTVARRVERALSSSIGFGGAAASIILGCVASPLDTRKAI